MSKFRERQVWQWTSLIRLLGIRMREGGKSMPVSGEWEVLTSNGFLCHSPDFCRAPSEKRVRPF